MIKSEAKGQAVLLGKGGEMGVLPLTSKKTNGNDQQWKFSYLGFCSAGPLFTVRPLNRFEFPALPQWGRPEMESRGAGISSAWLPFDLHPSPSEHLLPAQLFGQHCPACSAIIRLFHLKTTWPWALSLLTPLRNQTTPLRAFLCWAGGVFGDKSLLSTSERSYYYSSTRHW